MPSSVRLWVQWTPVRAFRWFSIILTRASEQSKNFWKDVTVNMLLETRSKWFVLQTQACSFFFDTCLLTSKVSPRTQCATISVNSVDVTWTNLGFHKCCGHLLGDVFLAPQIHAGLTRFQIDMSKYPILARLQEAYTEHPAFQAALPQNQPDAPPPQ